MTAEQLKEIKDYLVKTAIGSIWYVANGNVMKREFAEKFCIEDNEGNLKYVGKNIGQVAAELTDEIEKIKIVVSPNSISPILV